MLLTWILNTEKSFIFHLFLNYLNLFLQNFHLILVYFKLDLACFNVRVKRCRKCVKSVCPYALIYNIHRYFWVTLPISFWYWSKHLLTYSYQILLYIYLGKYYTSVKVLHINISIHDPYLSGSKLDEGHEQKWLC